LRKVKTRNFNSLNEILVTLADQLRPPERMTVHQAAAKYRYINQPGAYVGWWDNRVAPYMVEVMNTFASRDYNNMAFVGPAQCGKTDGIIVNGVMYSVIVDPMDTMVYCPTGSAARDFSIRPSAPACCRAPTQTTPSINTTSAA
jgi:phage terminase large subunit GpA-like protein